MLQQKLVILFFFYRLHNFIFISLFSLRCRCLRREFPTEIALIMWEACWINYLTDHFHLFLCLAIMCVYADDVIAQDLRTDEILLHFSSLAMYNGWEHYTWKGTRSASSFPSTCALILHISRTMSTMRSRNVGQRARSGRRVCWSRGHVLSLFK